MYSRQRERYAIGIFVSSISGSILYLLFGHWAFLAGALVGGLFFLMKLLLIRRG